MKKLINAKTNELIAQGEILNCRGGQFKFINNNGATILYNGYISNGRYMWNNWS